MQTIVNESAQVSFNNADFNLAGGDVNRIAVNVTVSNQPTQDSPSKLLWYFGQWLLGRTPVEPPVSAGLPLAAKASKDLASGLTERSSAPRTNDDNGNPGEVADDIEIIPLDRLDIRAELSRTAAPIRMPHEIYVSHLYPHGYGYPCANPKPRGDPIKIGDIGLLAGDRFDVLQDLYQLPQDFTGNLPGRMPQIRSEDIFEAGKCITSGVGSCYTTWCADQVTMNEITIHCCDQEGAALVRTSPAELSELQPKDRRRLHRYLCENAAALLDFLSESQDLSPGCSIYVVTGTIL